MLAFWGATLASVRISTPLSLLVMLAAIQPGAAFAQGPQNVLVVVNRASTASQEIGSYYVQKRAIPSTQVVQIDTPAVDEVTRPVYLNQIERPIFEWLSANGAQDRILYIVLTKGVPLRVIGTTGTSGSVASVDSELTLLYRRMIGVPLSATGSVVNPYFLGTRDLSSLRPFSHRDVDIYLVTRLDAFTVADAKAVIDRGLSPVREPRRILLKTRRDGGGGPGNGWLEDAGKRLSAQPGWAAETLVTSAFQPPTDKPLGGYYSWGSNDPLTAITPEPSYSFVPGALAAMFVSTDARTLQPPPAAWRPGRVHAGSNQSLIGTLIRDGVTGVAGHVAEPFLTAAIRPDILFPAYVRGLNLAEAFYAAMPLLGWQTVVIGDPLCAPFRDAVVPASDLSPGLDQITGLPQFLSDRRVSMLMALGAANRDAARYFVRSDQFVVKKDFKSAAEALESATKLNPAFNVARLALASVYESAGQFDAAIQQYRTVLETEPGSVIALNNLAYGLAVRRKAPAEALPFAKRALTLAPSAPEIQDTVAWVYHLLGDNRTAEPLIVTALKGAPGNAETHVHAAIILAANGKLIPASQVLNRAQALNPSLAQREDVRELRERLGASAK